MKKIKLLMIVFVLALPTAASFAQDTPPATAPAAQNTGATDDPALGGAPNDGSATQYSGDMATKPAINGNGGSMVFLAVVVALALGAVWVGTKTFRKRRP